MFGSYRITLAILVVVSHLNFHGAPHLLLILTHLCGRFAVINFYIISGFVMTKLSQKNFSGRGSANLFYVERMGRILPQYFFFLLISYVLSLILPPPEVFKPIPTVAGTIANIFIAPLDFYMFVPAIKAGTLIPQAFTLGLEVMFYALVPALILYRKARLIAFGCSAVIFAMAFVGLIDNDVFGYRLLPGTLIFFLMGMTMADVNQSHAKPLLCGTYFCFLLLGSLVGWQIVTVGKHSPLVTPTNLSVVAAVLVGGPVIYWLATQKIRKWDSIIGSGSYGIFLSHMLVIWWMPILLIKLNIASTAEIPLTLIASLLIGYLGYLAIEKPFKWLRTRFRSARCTLSSGYEQAAVHHHARH